MTAPSSKKQHLFFLFALFFSITVLSAQPGKDGTSQGGTIRFKPKKSNDSIPIVETKSSTIGASRVGTFPSRKKVFLDWVAPNASNIVVSAGMLDIALKIKTPSVEKVKMENIKVYNNGKIAGSKADEADLFGNEGEFNYKNKIRLQAGINKIEVAIETPDTKKRSAAIIIQYNNGVAKITSDGQEASNEKQLSIFWKTPDPIMLGGKPLAQKSMVLDISVGINSNQILTKDNLTLSINNADFTPSKSAVLNNIGSNYSYTDQVVLDDKISINEIYVKIAKGSNTAKTSTLKVNYSPEKPNLFVLSIGVKSNLQYPVNDANDFTEMFSSQGGREGNKLFNAIQIEKLLGDDATAQAIKKSIISLKIKMETGNISKDDLMLIFISSHGFMAGEDFRIEGNDYEARFKDISSVSYQKDILARLNEIPCKKVVFIDACHSGGAKADAANLNQSLLEYKKIPSGVSVITSSQEDEQSFEDDVWENGAFTEAISKGLLNGEADANENKIITIKELYDYIYKEVPEMVYKVKRKVQRPAMPRRELDNIGIYVLPD